MRAPKPAPGKLKKKPGIRRPSSPIRAPGGGESAGEGLFRLIFENSGDAILLTRPDGRISAANPAACRMFDRTQAEFRKLGREGIIDMSDPRISAILEERRRTGRFRGELNHVRKEGGSS
jgi:PAS domain S-box-containing protein